MKNLGVIANKDKAEAVSVLERLCKKADELSINLFTCDSTSDLLPDATHIPAAELPEKVEAVISLGGDGTMLYSARVLNGAEIPIIGVNLGTLGFMTSVRVEQLEEALEALLTGSYAYTERTVLEATSVNSDGATQHFRALNELVLGWGSSSKIALINLFIDGEKVNGYICDGMLISTPTGSTGHNLSAGGPIVHPQAQGLIVNFICAHSLSARPIVVPDHCEIVLEVDARSKDLVLAIDGQSSVTLSPGGKVTMQKSPRGVNFIRLPGASYYQVLKEKLNWSRSSVQ
jgi:NAD+ kinase